jgi:hypothetical protein
VDTPEGDIAMALTEPERARLVAAARSRFPLGQPPPTPADLAAWARHLAATFTADVPRPPGVPPPGAADFAVVTSFAVHGPPGLALPAPADLAPLRCCSN